MRSWGMLIDCRTFRLVMLAASVVNAPTWMNITGVAVGSLSAAETSHDVVIYGGTSCGVAAAVQARRMGKSVVLIEPTRRLGGLTTGGLGQTDIGNKAAIGGIAREFYQAVRKYYDDPNVWRWQTRAQYADSGQTRTASGEDTMWTFEPSAALRIFHDSVRENRLEVVYGERLDRKSGVAMTRSIPWRIIAIRMESGRTFSGQMFIDATYEGDLMAAGNVSYTVGREPNAQYHETLNGVQTKQAKYHQLVPALDPYVTPRDPGSGLLPFIDSTGPGDEGGGDRRVQAYCFRMCLTDHPDNRIPFHKPDGYDERWYELLLRNYEGGERGLPWINSPMPNRKTDTNNRLGFSTDFIGQNYDYPEASYDQREQIIARHRLYQQGLMWTLANHPRIPEAIRQEFARWGMCRDEFTEGQGWQEQLYIREARRMVSDCVMTQHHCQGRVTAEDAIGLAAYGMDSHHVQRYVEADGHVRNEGDVEVGGFTPYPISYRAIVPKADQCGNLLVPVCLSATHIAFGSIRMEPVFMVLGQSAATAAVHAIDEHVEVQRVDYAKLRERLLADKQMLVWTAEPPARTDRDWQVGNTSEMSGLKVMLSKPVLVARSKGYLWFPTVVRLSTGELAAMMSDYADEHVAQGTSRITWSTDGGLTWSTPSKALAGDGTLILPNGDLQWMPYYLRPLEQGGMGAPYQLCPRGERTLRVVQPGVTIEGWPRPDKSLAPQLGISGFVCNGQTVPLKAGGYLATLYGYFRDTNRYSLVASESPDGVRWKIRAVIADERCELPGREGPCESAVCRLKDGRLLCVFRLDSGVPYGHCFSSDDGQTWTKPLQLKEAHSVQPSLAVLPDGLVALSGGRPGLFLWLNPDGTAATWQRVDLLANHNTHQPEKPIHGAGNTSSYTEVITLDDAHLLYIYDRIPNGWKAITADSPETNSVWVVRVTLRRG